MRHRIAAGLVVAWLLAFLSWSGGEQASSTRVQTMNRPLLLLTDPTTTTLPPTTTTAPPPTTTTTAPPSPTTTTAPPAPPTAPPPPPAPSGGCGGLEAAIGAHFPADQIATACRVIACETGGTFSPTIHNQTSSASGILQFLDSTWTSTTGLAPPAAAYPLDQQLAAGAALWATSGWSPWSCA